MIHPGAMTLRRLFAAEPVGNDVSSHVEACSECRAKLKVLEDEQKKFEAVIPFERFSAGVERAGRTPRRVPLERKPQRMLLALAAGLVVMASVPLILSAGNDTPINRVKGGGVQVVVRGAMNGPQRPGSDDPSRPEPLASGEAVRIGFEPGHGAFLQAITVDDQGKVEPLFAGKAPADGFLPDAMELTGKGLERMIFVFSEEPLPMGELEKAARVRYDEARGNLLQMGNLEVRGEQYHRTFLKP